MLTEMTELRVLRDELRERIGELITLLRDRNAEYDKAWNRLTHYRKIYKDLTKETNELKEELNSMSTQLKFETSTRAEEMTTAKENAEWWRDQNLAQHEVLAQQENRINDLMTENDKKQKEFDKLRECMGKLSEQHKRAKEGLVSSNRKKDQEIQTLSDRLGDRS